MSEAADIKPSVLIVGLGLIGSSFARALKAGGLAREVTGFDASADVRRRAAALKVFDGVADSLNAAASAADIVLMATPVGAMPEAAQALAPLLRPGAIVTDVGSVKGSVAALADLFTRQVHFVPGHPIAGTEQSGPEAGFAELFQGRWCILTPLEGRDDAYAKAVDTVAALWRGVGSDVEIMSAAHHDLALAMTSHLPHLIAYTIVGTADDLESVTKSEIVKYSAGGFRDFTRIAASDPVMWRDVFLNNSDAVLEVLGRFSEELSALQRAIRWKDGAALEKTFARTRDLRRQIVEAGQEDPAPNFGRGAKDPETPPSE